MNDGRVIECDTPARLFNEPRTAFVARFLGSGSIVAINSIKKHADGVSTVISDLGEAPLLFDVRTEHALLVPPDAVSLVSIEAGDAQRRMTVAETVFEGDATTVVLETPNKLVRLRTTLGRREKAPASGQIVGVRINWSLVRPVLETNVP